MIKPMNLLMVKLMTERDVGSSRAMQLGLVAAMMPGMQGVLMATLIARNEAVAAAPPIVLGPPVPRLPAGHDKPVR
jgi:hypothetical protein